MSFALTIYRRNMSFSGDVLDLILIKGVFNIKDPTLINIIIFYYYNSLLLNSSQMLGEHDPT